MRKGADQEDPPRRVHAAGDSAGRSDRRPAGWGVFLSALSVLLVAGVLLLGMAWRQTPEPSPVQPAPADRLEPVSAALQVLHRAANDAAREKALAQSASPLQAGMRAGLRLAGEVTSDTEVFHEPGLGEPREVLQHISTFGTPNPVLVTSETWDEQGAHWYEVLLPRKPNGTRGWVRAESLDTYWLEHSIHIDVGDRKLTLFERGRLVQTYPVGVGRQATPTPRGDFFITVRLSPPDPGGPYGPLAMGLSAYSEVLTWWAGGGQAAIHGTNYPGGIGTAVSNGCIRMLNADVLALGKLALLGTPVRITD